MKRRVLLYTALLMLIGLVVLTGAATPVAQAKHWGFHNGYLYGNYATQSTGTINFPPGTPFSVFNGPFALYGLVSADGKGNLKKELVFNMNGQILRGSFEATYHVNHDGTFTESFNFPMPPEMGLPYIIMNFDGIIMDQGRSAQLILSSLSGPGGASLGLPEGYVGMVITGAMTRQ